MCLHDGLIAVVFQNLRTGGLPRTINLGISQLRY